jgi:hypothetical protein
MMRCKIKNNLKNVTQHSHLEKVIVTSSGIWIGAMVPVCISHIKRFHFYTMNLELLDPFGRQVPDRVDATIQLADALHYPLQQQRESSKSQPSKHGRNYDQAEEDHDNDDDDVDMGDDEFDAATNDNSLKQNRRQRRISEKAVDDDDDDEWKAALHVAYNRRGNYLAVGYGSGTVAVFCTLTRTLSALYYTDDSTKQKSVSNNKNKNTKTKVKTTSTGCSNLSWARRSRRLLVGNYGDTRVKLYDTTHPVGPEDCASGVAMLVSVGQTAAAAAAASSAAADLDDGDNDSTMGEKEPKIKSTVTTPTATRYNIPSATGSSPSVIPPIHSYETTIRTPFATNYDDKKYTFVRKARPLANTVLEPDGLVEGIGCETIHDTTTTTLTATKLNTSNKITRYPCVSFKFPHSVIGSLHIHPRHQQTGIAVLSDGSLNIFWVPSASAFMNDEVNCNSSKAQSSFDKQDNIRNVDSVKILPMYTKQFISCASFDALGDRIYAVTKSGTLLGFDVTKIWTILYGNKSKVQQLPLLEPIVVVPRSSGSKANDSSTGVSIWHLLVSRNGKFLIINASDGTIRLYSTNEFWKFGIDNAIPLKPTWVFQDVVTKVKFASCDLSGDGEYVVGGANGADNKYELHIWNTSTGALMDKLTGASTILYSVAWHPTRSFLAVACADGIVDIWGPRINWTAFAPDFQTLPMNVEYIEREDEFDVDEHGRHLAEGYYVNNESFDANGSTTTPINATKIEPVPVFASDSEDEEDVFEFETRAKNLLVGRVVEKTNKKGVLDD